MKIILNERTAKKVQLEYGSIENYADRFRKLGFDFVDIKVWENK